MDERWGLILKEMDTLFSFFAGIGALAGGFGALYAVYLAKRYFVDQQVKRLELENFYSIRGEMYWEADKLENLCQSLFHTRAFREEISVHFEEVVSNAPYSIGDNEFYLSGLPRNLYIDVMAKRLYSKRNALESSVNKIKSQVVFCGRKTLIDEFSKIETIFNRWWGIYYHEVDGGNEKMFIELGEGKLLSPGNTDRQDLQYRLAMGYYEMNIGEMPGDDSIEVITLIQNFKINILKQIENILEEEKL